MSRAVLRDWIDNPIFVKHLRSRLRIQTLAAAVVVVVVLGICITWGGYELKAFETGGAFGALLSLQAIILVVMGATQIGASVGAARESGILDFHRVSPLTPTALTIGFFFGAPIREYILFACTLPFSAVCLAFGTPSLRHFAEWTVLLAASAWLFHGLALLNGLVAKGRANPRGVVFLLIFAVFVAGYITTVFLVRLGAAVEADQLLTFYGISLPWLAVVLLYMAAILYFIYRAARRKMGSERIHALSKPQAIAALLTMAVLVVGSIWRRQEYPTLEVGALYLLVITTISLTVTVSPNRAEYDRGLWRARKLGLSHLPWWDDLSLNRVCLLLLCAIVLATATFASSGAAETRAIGSALGSEPGSFHLAIAISVLVIAYFGLAHQYFALRFGGRSRIYFALFLFLAWLVPLVAGMILAIASLSPNSAAENASAILVSLSPVAGIGASALADLAGPYRTAIQAAAITPALLFTFVFNSLLVSARRRAYKEFLIAAQAAGRPTPAIPRVSTDGDIVLPEGAERELESAGGIEGGRS